ncbi:MAG: hypothetical protein JWM42_466 [Burkholderia sp.]|nr:hypothetical protein [Burkholderia sp.]
MRPLVVVFLAPFFNYLPGMAHRDEPMLVQALIPEFAVEALDVRILLWLAGLDKVRV